MKSLEEHVLLAQTASPVERRALLKLLVLDVDFLLVNEEGEHFEVDSLHRVEERSHTLAVFHLPVHVELVEKTGERNTADLACDVTQTRLLFPINLLGRQSRFIQSSSLTA